ncbi:MAG: hypothetical protein LVQ96_04895 [Thermoplasmatales archaeon]|nr:hypothetical protein [Thermoplasmatales archaeon]MCW6170490.1 hypothetical protein [Thermoplasmatales archaeon]
MSGLNLDDDYSNRKVIVPKESLHPSYFSADGTKLPSVTTVLSIINKPYLVKWANKMGLQGINVEEYNRGITGIGTLTHARIQAFLEGVPIDDSGYTEREISISLSCFNGFMKWYNGHSIKRILTEKSLISEEHKFGGTIDAFLLVDDIPTIIDFKTSNQISNEYYSQLSAYDILLRENNYKAEKTAILRLPKIEPEITSMEPTYEYVEKTVDELLNHREIFMKALELYKAMNTF